MLSDKLRPNPAYPETKTTGVYGYRSAHGTGDAEQVRRRVLRWSPRSLLDDAGGMLNWENRGFSIDETVRIAGYDRAGPERLLRFCPPMFLLRGLDMFPRTVAY
jgi:hypothetical protein